MQGRVYMLNHILLFAAPWTAWTVAHQAPLSMGFSWQAYWSGLPSPSPGDLPNPGIKPESPVSPALQADSLPLCHLGSPACARAQTRKGQDQDTH